jgi:hypothetical protein
MKNIFPLLCFFVATILTSVLSTNSIGQDKVHFELKVEPASDTIRGGDQLAYIVKITNLGPSTATGVTLITNLVGVVRMNSIVHPKGTCETNEAPAERELRCGVGDLNQGESLSVNCTLTVGDIDEPSAQEKERNDRMLKAMSAASGNNEVRPAESSTLFARLRSIFLKFVFVQFCQRQGRWIFHHDQSACGHPASCKLGHRPSGCADRKR